MERRHLHFDLVPEARGRQARPADRRRRRGRQAEQRLRGCKEVEEGAAIQTQAASDPESIHPLLCDQQQVADYWVWKSDAEATAKAAREDRPSFVNGKIVVTTGEALLAKQYDSDKSKTLPEEIKAACGCGTVVTP